MSTYLFSLFGNPLLKPLSENLNIYTGDVKLKHFHNQESQIEISSNISGKRVILIDSLDRPNNKLLDLIFFAKTAKENGASDIGLIATYFPYLTQYKANKNCSNGSSYYIDIIQELFNWVIIPEPTLDQRNDLNNFFTCPAHKLQLSTLIGDWIARKQPDSFIISQKNKNPVLAQKIATIAGVECIELDEAYHTTENLPTDMRAIFINDVISSGTSVFEAKKTIEQTLNYKPILLAAHGIFTQNSYQILETEFEYVITCNTIPHKSNAIDILAPLTKLCSSLI
jgi:ribose-phosphate pyrophosphokinase